MKIPPDIKKRVDAKVEHFLHLAEHNCGIRLLTPQIEYNLRGRTAGQAWPRLNKIRINPVLLLENLDTYIDDRTLGHEIAHLAARKIDPCGRSHGRTWQGVMRAFKLDPERCHSYDVTNSQTRKRELFVWECGHGVKMHLGPTQHKKMTDKSRYSLRSHNCDAKQYEFSGTIITVK